mmetsp:Transcript_37159/g.110965  ORF Transcript_37159/g.110965 Transcript_37159/m.110965 type:complete len:241 (+) Transcript_37159:651-1373(+)
MRGPNRGLGCVATDGKLQLCLHRRPDIGVGWTAAAGGNLSEAWAARGRGRVMLAPRLAAAGLLAGAGSAGFAAAVLSGPLREDRHPHVPDQQPCGVLLLARVVVVQDQGAREAGEEGVDGPGQAGALGGQAVQLHRLRVVLRHHQRDVAASCHELLQHRAPEALDDRHARAEAGGVGGAERGLGHLAGIEVQKVLGHAVVDVHRHGAASPAALGAHTLREVVPPVARAILSRHLAGEPQH